ncbi:MAG: hypothetical protein J6D42_09945 [Clostridia bacterium]|nr:hypothetical protein [Clostridia bacterium]
MKKLIILVLSLIFVLAFVGCNNNDVKYDLPLMVMIDGVLYENTGDESDRLKTDIMTFDGEITSAVNGTEFPVENDQSNFGTGYLYVFGNNNTVEVLVDNAFWIFEPDITEQSK